MKRLRIVKDRQIEFIDKDILGFIHRDIVESSTGAVVYLPKEFIGKKAYVVICK